MQIALVGIGKIALDQHVPSIAASPDWELAATVSRHGTVDGVEAFTDFDAMLAARPDIRVVSLCMPPVPRYDYAAKAIRAARHVMLEKPPGATLSECHALADMAAAQRVSLYATWHSRSADKVQAAKAWLAGKTLRKFTVTWKEDVRRWHPGQEWIWEPGGMGVFDPGINALSIVTEILADPIHVTSALLEVPENRQAPIAAKMAFHHPTAEVAMEFDWRQEGDQTWSIEAECDEARLRCTTAARGCWSTGPRPATRPARRSRANTRGFMPGCPSWCARAPRTSTLRRCAMWPMPSPSDGASWSRPSRSNPWPSISQTRRRDCRST